MQKTQTFASIPHMAEPLEPIQLHTPPELAMDDERFFQFCQANPENRMERNSEGDILVMTPEAASSGAGNARLARFFDLWAETDGSGRVFGSSTGFRLSNGAIRSPDISWVSNARLAAVSDEDWHRFLPLCPDFVLELRSPADRLLVLQDKMREYIANGARLGWLLDLANKQVHIYRPDGRPDILDNPTDIGGDAVLPNFRLPVPRIWAAMKPTRPGNP